MEISKMLTISTAHITMETARELNIESNTNNMQLSVYKKSDYGWFIYVNDDLDNRTIPDDLLKCLEFAKDLGCEWLCLDCDGEVLEYLYTYEW